MCFGFGARALNIRNRVQLFWTSNFHLYGGSMVRGGGHPGSMVRGGTPKIK